ncbi:uncharacterized protein N7477_009510 [Penicillium maclennaniae]|uniref:uncharacterized protein n=1 Tax=Penicillium maclennaniae TaxID=1343394 RepID=UPI0025419E79|nr:uncharacterized protein N7477_009510 [Penicillium maclennaniae]KAJ5661894.1 hypothetical protein N7477_009510 [Penicillium maclennaniae]
MARYSHYLLALLSAFVATLFWLSWGLKDSVPSLALTVGSNCILNENATPTTTPYASETPSAPVSSPTSSPDDIDEAYAGSAAYKLPAIKSKQHLAAAAFPAKLWQKSGTHGIDESRREDMRSWQIQSPNLRHEILTDGSVPILKADLLRQFILYNDGGIWSDLDVTCHVPIDKWIPEQYKARTNVVVGLEFDGAQFASWTVMAKPRTSHIASVLRYIILALEQSALDYNTTISGLTMQTISDVVDVTGPQAMTRGIIQSLEKELGLPVGRPNISELYEPVLLGDVLVLPNAAFAAMQGGWPTDRGPYLVEHHYAGSWKNDKGGESKVEDKTPELQAPEVQGSAIQAPETQTPEIPTSEIPTSDFPTLKAHNSDINPETDKGVELA